MSRINIEKRLQSMLGIKYTVSEPEFYPIMPEIRNGRNKLIQQLFDSLRAQVGNKRQIYKTYTELQSQPLVESLLMKVSVDLLWKGRAESKPFLEVEYLPDKEIQETLNEVLKNFHVENHIAESIFDLLLFGEYYFHIDWKNTEIDDKYDYPDLLPVYTRGEIDKVLTTMVSENIIHKFSEFSDNNFVEPDNVLVISLPGRRFKVKVKDETGSEYYVKIPTPFVIPSAITLLNSLALMEKLIPLTQVIRMDRGQIVTISVPPNVPVKQIFDICKEYEKHLNSTLGLNLSYNSMEEILSSFGRFKCIPSLNTGKAEMGVRDQPEPRTVDIHDLEYLVNTIANRIGVPVSYIIDLGQQEDPKTLLSYLQRLHFIRVEIGKSVRVFLLNYLEQRRKSGERFKMIKPDELKVKIPSIPGLDTLDAIDVADSLSGMLSNVQRIIDDFGRVFAADENLPELDRKAMLDVLNTKLEPVIGRKIFDLSKLKKSKYKDTEDEREPLKGQSRKVDISKPGLRGSNRKEEPEPEPTTGEPGQEKETTITEPSQLV